MSTEPICLTTPPAKGPAEEYILPENVLDAIPLLARLAPCTDPFVRKQAEMDIREALEGRGPEALRQLEAALDYGDCSTRMCKSEPYVFREALFRICFDD